MWRGINAGHTFRGRIRWKVFKELVCFDKCYIWKARTYTTHPIYGFTSTHLHRVGWGWNISVRTLSYLLDVCHFKMRHFMHTAVYSMYILLLIAISVSVAPPRQSAHKFGIRVQSTWHPQLNELVNFFNLKHWNGFLLFHNNRCYLIVQSFALKKCIVGLNK